METYFVNYCDMLLKKRWQQLWSRRHNKYLFWLQFKADKTLAVQEAHDLERMTLSSAEVPAVISRDLDAMNVMSSSCVAGLR